MYDHERHPLFNARIEDNCAFITLTQGFEAVVDSCDVPLLQKFCWHVHMNKHGHAYAAGTFNRKRQLMHRLLLEAKRLQFVDHIDGNGLNNRRNNIRICTHADNMRNRVIHRNNRLGIKGVAQKNGRFTACITHDGRRIKLGGYATAEEAAAAYRGAAKALWGEFAPK